MGHLGVHLQRRDPRRYVQEVLVHHRLETVVGRVVGRGDRAVHGRRGAVVGQLHCSAAMLLPCAATCPSVVARAAAVARGAIAGASALLSIFEASSAVTLSSRDWMAAALLPEAAVFTARSVTCAYGVRARASCPAVTCVDIAGDRSFKHVYICFRRLSPVVGQGAKRLAVRQTYLTGPSWHSGRSEKLFDAPPPHRQPRKWCGLQKLGLCRMSVECGSLVKPAQCFETLTSSRPRIATLEAGATLLACPLGLTTRQQKPALTSCLQHLGLCKFLCSLSPLGRMPKNVLLQPTRLPGRYNDWADDCLARFAHRPANRVRFSPTSLAQAGRGITLCSAEAPWRPEHLCSKAFPPPEHLAATAEFAHKLQASENKLMKVAALRVQQCPRIVCHCASSRRRCNPALKRGTFAPGP